MKARLIPIVAMLAVLALTGCNGKGDSSGDIKAVTASPENKGSNTDVYNPNFSEEDSSSVKDTEPDETGNVVIVTKKKSSGTGEENSSEPDDTSETDDTSSSDTPTETQRGTTTTDRYTTTTPLPYTFPTQTQPTGAYPTYTVTQRPTATAKPTQTTTKSVTKPTAQTTKKETTRQVTKTVSPTIIHTMKMSEYMLFLSVGDTHMLYARYEPASMKVNLVWTTNRNDIATVDKTGKVRAVGSGSAIITVTDTYSGLSASCMVRI